MSGRAFLEMFKEANEREKKSLPPSNKPEPDLPPDLVNPPPVPPKNR
jgi:hypothetical protein